MDYEYINGDWDVSGLVKIRYIPESGDPYEDTEDESKWAERTITLEHLTEALSLAIKEGYRHVPCGGLIDADLERFDSCVADILLQLTVYGKEVWA